jgi:hypothetical protein
MTDRNQFAGALLDALGAPNNDSTLGFLVAWMAREGTSAANNPLATTEPAPGATDFNSVGVKNYPDEATGVQATVATLEGGYPGIVGDLRAGDGGAAGQEHAELSKWSGGGYDTIGAGGPNAPIPQGDHMSGESWLSSFGQGVGQIIVDLLTIVGLGLGGGQAAAAPELLNLEQDAFKVNQTRILTPDQLAAAVLKNQIDGTQAQQEATLSGLNESRFGVLLETIGNPPGPQELLTMLRRGTINEGSAVQGLRESYLRNEWVPFLLDLVAEILSTDEAVTAAVQNHLAYDDAATAAQRNGVGRDVFDVMYQNAGNPPGPQQMLALWVRGYVDEATVDQALRESRLKDKYIDAIKKLAIRKIPLRSVVQLLNAGAINDAQATQYLKELGYSDADTAALIAGHKATGTTAQKELSVSAIRQLFTDNLIDGTEAVQDLVAIKYDPVAAQQLVSLWSTETARAVRTNGISRTRSLYEARHIDRQTASNTLDRLAVPPGLRDQMLATWDLGIASVVKTLTPTDICGAGRLGVFQPSEVLSRLQAEGYSADDALTFAYVHRGIAQPSTTGA